MARPPRIIKLTDIEVTKTRGDDLRFSYSCPKCGDSLQSINDEVMRQERCPTCGRAFVFETAVQRTWLSYLAEKQRAEEEKSLKQQRKRPTHPNIYLFALLVIFFLFPLAFKLVDWIQQLPIKPLTVEQAEALGKNDGWLGLDRRTTITAEMVKALIKYETNWESHLDGLTDITPKAAEALAKSRSSLSLNGLRLITPEVAEALAKSRSSLSLNGLRLITPEVAEALANSDGGSLELNGLTDITPKAAEALAKHEGFLYLNGLTEITPKEADCLAKHEGFLYLNGLTTLTSAALAKKIVFRSIQLNLDGLTMITPEVAQELAKVKYQLDLNGLTADSFTPEIAEALAEHYGNLSLDGLDAVTTEEAEALIDHEGPLYLNGLFAIGLFATEALAKHQGTVYIPRITLSWDEKETLYNNGRNLRTKSRYDYRGSIENPKPAPVKDAPEKFPVNPNTIKSLTVEQAADLVAKVEGESLWLSGLNSIDKDVAQELAKYEGSLHLNGLKLIRPDVAQELANVKGGLHLDGLTSIGKDVAQELAKYEGSLHLNGLKLIRPDVAQELANVKGGLHLDGLTSIDKDVAQELAKCEGTLGLNGRTLISKESSIEGYYAGISRSIAQALSKFKGNKLEITCPDNDSINMSQNKFALETLKSNPNICFNWQRVEDFLNSLP